MRKVIMLLRHAESVKNIENRFASNKSLENLTETGKAQSCQFGEQIDFFLKNNCLTVKNIYCANSSRAIQTAEIIASKLGANVVSADEFKSFSIGHYSGMSESSLAMVAPKFINDLSLYRKGLLNSYDIIYEGSKKNLQEYESDVKKRFLEIVNNSEQEDCKIIVMHRSALTATLLDFARNYYKYPIDFYGYVEIEIGTVSLIDFSDGNVSFIGVTIDTKSLLDLKI